MAAVSMTPLAVWWSAVRPATLAASVAPVLTGTAVAVHDGVSAPVAGLAALLVALAMQLGVNFANDYSDHRRGADHEGRIGPVRAASSGVVRPTDVRLAALAAFAMAALVGLLLSLATDWRLIPVGVACVLAGWLYTGGPRPYGYLGLGELFVFVFFGLVATVGTAYVEELRIVPLAVIGGCCMGFLATAVLVLNNIRDIESDLAAGKRTLATRLGRVRTRWLLIALVAAAFAMPLIAIPGGPAPLALIATAGGLALAVPAVRLALSSTAGPVLVRALKLMAGAELVTALLWSLALVLG